MAACVLCGKNAGWFKTEHIECRRRHDEGRLKTSRATKDDDARPGQEPEEAKAAASIGSRGADAAMSTRNPEEENEKIVSERQASEETTLAAGSPHSFGEIIGQTQAVDRLRAIADLAKVKGKPASHLLLIGPDGAAKRTLAGAFANELSATLVIASGPFMPRGGDLLGILANLNENDVLLIQDIHRLSREQNELLDPALRTFAVQFVAERGLHARSIKHRLSPFTCIGTAPSERDVPATIKSLFPITITLRPYSEEELSRMAVASCERQGFQIDDAAAALVARLSGGSLGQLGALLQFLEGPHRIITGEYAADLLSQLGFGSSATPVGGAPDDLMNLSGVEFEQLIKSLLDRLGFQTELTAASGDGGIDIVAHLDRPIVGGKYLIQCKRFAEGAMVGAPTVREFYGAVVADRAAVKGVLITTSNFSSQAREFAAQLRIELVDGQQLQDLLKPRSESSEPGQSLPGARHAP